VKAFKKLAVANGHGICCGGIEVITGPRFTGKATELIRRVQRERLQGLGSLFLAYSADGLGDARMTHDGLSVPATAFPALMRLCDQCLACDVIGIDDGLDGTRQREPFGRFLSIIAACESVAKMSAVCPATGGDAFFTRCTGPGGGRRCLAVGVLRERRLSCIAC
jgi:thymidine kinase